MLIIRYNYAFDFTFDGAEQGSGKQDGRQESDGHSEEEMNADSYGPSRREPFGTGSTYDGDIPVQSSLPRERAITQPGAYEGSGVVDGRASPMNNEDGVPEEDDADGPSVEEGTDDVWSPHSAELVDRPMKLRGSPRLYTSQQDSNRRKRPIRNNDNPSLEPVDSAENMRDNSGDDDATYTETVEEVGKEETRQTFGGGEPYSETVEEVGRPESRKTFGSNSNLKETQKVSDGEAYSETVEEVGRPETRRTFNIQPDSKGLRQDADEKAYSETVEEVGRPESRTSFGGHMNSEGLRDNEPSEQEMLEAFKSAGLEEAFSKGEG